MEENVIKQIETNGFYKFFLNTDTKTVLDHSLSVTEQVKRLGEGIELLSQELNKQVLENHDDLLSQANHATKLEDILNVMNTHIQNLYANAERLKATITVPYNALETHTKVLQRLHTASHILRQVNRVQQLSKRLSHTNDPVHKATILQELEQLALDADLADIDAVTSELRNVRTQQQKVVKLANGSLNQGIVNENETQTSTALQIFINLGTINTTLDELVKHNLNECRDILKTALDVNAVIKPKSYASGRVNFSSTQGFRNKVWNELEKAFSEDIFQICRQVKYLQTVLNNMHLHNVHMTIAPSFWKSFGGILHETIKQSSSAVQQMLEEDYPKLLKNYDEMIQKLKYEHFTFERNVLNKMENAYLSKCLTRMLDSVQAVFNKESKSLTHDDIDSIVRVLSSELSVAIVEEHLNELVAKNVAKSVKMFAVKTEQLTENGPEAAQVIAGVPNSGQQTNVQLANSLYYFQTQIQRMLSNMKESLSEGCVKIVNEGIQALEHLTSSIMEPLIVSTNSVIETIIVTIHLESDWIKLVVPASGKSTSSSPYMKELTQFITRVFNTYLAGFDNKAILTERCNEIALRTIELFVRHSSILRQISQGGRVRLQNDYQQLELALKVICPHLPDLGRPYRLLKSMASLMVLSPEQIIAGQVTGSSVPSSTILLMLFSFADSEMASPHQNTGWSLPKLSSWLDDHPSESDRLDLVAGALQKYESVIRVKDSTNYDPVYPIMSQFLETTMQNMK